MPLTSTGKIVSSVISQGKATKNVSSASKKARLNTNAQKRDLKRKTVAEDVKFFSTSSGGGESVSAHPADSPGGAPRIVSVIPLISDISPRRLLVDLLPTLGLPEAELQEAISTARSTGTYLVRAPRFKTSLQINILPPLSVYVALDAALVSDYIVLLMSSTKEVQLEGEAVLRCLQAQCGGVEVVPCVQAPADEPITPQTRTGIHKSLLSFSRYFFPSIEKVFSADTPNESALLARALCEATPKTSRDDGRAYVVAEGSEGVRWIAGEEGSEGRLEITGTVRGGCLSADRLVHIPGEGDFQIEQVSAL